MTFDADAFEGVAKGRTAAAQAPPPTPPPQPEGEVVAPSAIIYPSHSGGPGHIVTINAVGVMSCTCEGGSHGRICWAQKQARRLIGKE